MLIRSLILTVALVILWEITLAILGGDPSSLQGLGGGASIGVISSVLTDNG